MRVSVVIPCYKDAKTIGRALDSVFAQSRLPDEVIVVNDASPETIEILSVLEGYPSVRYVFNETNLGLAATRNVGVRMSTADIVSFLDADDELHPQKIEYQLTIYEEGVALSCDVQRIGDVRGVDQTKIYLGEPTTRIEADSSIMVKRNALTGASLMISRRLFLSLGGYDEKLRSCEDFDLWLRILDAGIKVYNIKLPLYLYRINEYGLSRNLYNISCWELVVVNKYYSRHGAKRAWLSSRDATCFIWLCKHLIRYEASGDANLLKSIVKNKDNLIASRFLRVVLGLALKFHIFKLWVFFGLQRFGSKR